MKTYDIAKGAGGVRLADETPSSPKFRGVVTGPSQILQSIGQISTRSHPLVSDIGIVEQSALESSHPRTLMALYSTVSFLVPILIYSSLSHTENCVV